MLFILIHETLVFMIRIHIPFNIIMILCFLKSKSLIMIRYIVIHLTESVRCSLMQVELLLLLGSAHKSWALPHLCSRHWSTCCYNSRSSIWSLRSMCWMPQTLSFLYFLIYMSHRILYMYIMRILLLIKWCHSKFLMRQCLVFTSWWSFFLCSRSNNILMLIWLNIYETAVAYWEKIKIIQKSS
jgi:hypothetical protein